MITDIEIPRTMLNNNDLFFTKFNIMIDDNNVKIPYKSGVVKSCNIKFFISLVEYPRFSKFFLIEKSFINPCVEIFEK